MTTAFSRETRHDGAILMNYKPDVGVLYECIINIRRINQEGKNVEKNEEREAFDVGVVEEDSNPNQEISRGCHLL